MRTPIVATLAAVVPALFVAGVAGQPAGAEHLQPAGAASCDQGATTSPVTAEPVADVPSDVVITSFDGAPIRAHWFPVDGDKASPTILMGPGYGMPGDTDVAAPSLLGTVPSISMLLDAGYNVLTWDPRGIGESGGMIELDSPEFEGRDVQVLLDWVAEQPVALTDAEGDPRVGMVGGSYGGGIQLTVASIDCRLEAIVPTVPWHSVVTSLYPNETPKTGWTNLLNAVTANASRDPQIDATTASIADGLLSADEVAWFASRGPGDNIERIDTPTMLIAGTVDTLFPLDETVPIHQSLVERGVPTELLWFCGGHGMCITNEDDSARVLDGTLAWLARYVKGDETVDTGPVFDAVDDEGAVYIADAFPAVETTLGGHGSGTLELVAEGGSGPIPVPEDSPSLAGVVAGITPGPATNAVNVDVTPESDALVLGAPHVSFTYVGSPGEGDLPARVYAQLVDVERGVVIGNTVELDSESHTVDVDLEMVFQSVAAGQTVQLQIVAATALFRAPQLGGSIEFQSIDVELPIVTSLAP